jgi:hypothetical protein
MAAAPSPSPQPRSVDEAVSAFATLQPGPVPVSAALPAVIDVEASGFGRDSYPIEVGFVLEDGRSGCTLIRPEPDWTHWDVSAERAHGIGRDLLMRHGRSAGDVARWLNQHLAGRIAYSDGWAHDYPWLARLFDAAQVSPHFRVGHLRELLDDASAATWQSRLAEVRSLQEGQRHRASVDARHIRAALARSLAPR